jgi:RNA-directed DNA polymerase
VGDSGQARHGPSEARSVTMTTRLDRFTQKARELCEERFTSLMGLLFDPEGLTKVDYAEGLEERLTDLSARLRRLGYRPKPVRRAYIPKGDSRYRALGIPSFEDRLVQDRLSRSFATARMVFGRARVAHDALARVAEIITCEHTQWVVEADIQGFFDHVSHDHLMRFLEHRIADPVLLRTVRRFLKAGVMEGGAFIASEEGTPQGGLVSPVLANIYLHYVLDLWFEKRYANSCQGKAHLVRFADDFVACFECEEDTRRFLSELAERLTAFGLEVEPNKTAVLRFGAKAARQCHRDGLRRPRTFSFLGFTHYVTCSRRGRFQVGRKTDRRRFRNKLKRLNQRLRALRGEGGKAMMDYLRSHVRGHIQYYGVSGNIRRVTSYVYFAGKLLIRPRASSASSIPSRSGRCGSNVAGRRTPSRCPPYS